MYSQEPLNRVKQSNIYYICRPALVSVLPYQIYDGLIFGTQPTLLNVRTIAEGTFPETKVSRLSSPPRDPDQRFSTGGTETLRGVSRIVLT